MLNTFFTKESHESDIELEVNEDVLKRIYNDNIKPTDILPIEFFFLTDTEQKAINFKTCLLEHFPEYTDLKIQDYDGDFEISGTTGPNEMNLEVINRWNKIMWDLGYNYDCKLDGWQVGT